LKEARLVYDVIKQENPYLVVSLHEFDGDKAFMYYTGNVLSTCNKILSVMKKRFEIQSGKIDKMVKTDKCDELPKNGMIHCSNTYNDTLEDRLITNGIPCITVELPNKSEIKDRKDCNCS